MLVLNERRVGRGPKRDVLLQAAHLIFLPAAVIKAVRLAKFMAVGKRRGPAGGVLGPAVVAAALPGAVSVMAVRRDSPDDVFDGGGGVPASGSEATVPVFRHQPPPLPRPVPRSEWGLLQIPEVAPEYSAWVRCLRNVSGGGGHGRRRRQGGSKTQRRTTNITQTRVNVQNALGVQPYL